MKAKIDYNKISSVYNERYKVSPLNGIRKYLEQLTLKRPPQTILEAGCGTGYWLSILAKGNYKLYGIDYSKGMLRQIECTKSKIFLINADACRIPIKENYFDFIYCINAIHQFNDPKQFIRNVSRLLKLDGTLSIIGYDPFAPDTTWYLYDYFSDTYNTDINRYPKFSYIHSEMTTNGFGNILLQKVDNVSNTKKGREILKDHFLDKKGSSQLALLSDEEYTNGIEKIILDIEKSEKENTELHFETNLSFYSITGTK